MRKLLIASIFILVTPSLSSAVSYDFYRSGRCDDQYAAYCGVTCPVIDANMDDSAWGYNGELWTKNVGPWPNYVTGELSVKDSALVITHDANYVYIGLLSSDLEANTHCGEQDVGQGDGLTLFFDIDENPYGPPDYVDFWEVAISLEGCESSAWYSTVGDPHWDWEPTGLLIGGVSGEGIEIAIPASAFSYALSSDPIPSLLEYGVGFCACRSGDSCWCGITGGTVYDPYQWGWVHFMHPVGVNSPTSWGEIKTTFK